MQTRMIDAPVGNDDPFDISPSKQGATGDGSGGSAADGEGSGPLHHAFRTLLPMATC